MKNIKKENIYTRRIVTEIRNLLDEIDRMKTAITDYNIQEVQEITKDIIYEMSARHLEMISNPYHNNFNVGIPVTNPSFQKVIKCSNNFQALNDTSCSLQEFIGLLLK